MIWLRTSNHRFGGEAQATKTQKKNLYKASEQQQPRAVVAVAAAAAKAEKQSNNKNQQTVCVRAWRESERS